MDLAGLVKQLYSNHIWIPVVCDTVWKPVTMFASDELVTPDNYLDFVG